MEITFTHTDIAAAAAAFFKAFQNQRYWAFDAPMGAGKTTFINALCREVLHIKDVSSSPTFSIINEYESEAYGKIIHMDWYRLKDEEEAIQAGVEDALYAGALCLIEWPEKAAGLLPDETLYLRIDIVDEHTRKITAE